MDGKSKIEKLRDACALGEEGDEYLKWRKHVVVEQQHEFCRTWCEARYAAGNDNHVGRDWKKH